MDRIDRIGPQPAAVACGRELDPDRDDIAERRRRDERAPPPRAPRAAARRRRRRDDDEPPHHDRRAGLTQSAARLARRPTGT